MLLELQNDEVEASAVRFSLKEDGSLAMKVQHSQTYSSARATEVQRLAMVAIYAGASQYDSDDFESCLLNGKEVLPKVVAK